MARCSLHKFQYCLLIFGSAVLSSCALVSHHDIHHIRLTHGRQRLPQPLSRLQSSVKSNDYSTAASPVPEKSPESNFWAAIQKNTTSSSNSIPAIHGLDRETGPLPPGAYRTIDKDLASPCVLAVGIQPPLNGIDGENIWEEGVKNCQKLIDSGFNTFRVNSVHLQGKNEDKKKPGGKKPRKTLSSMALERLKQRTSQTEIRHETEEHFYRTLRQSTPSSVLRSCHFMVNLEVPPILSEDSFLSRIEKESSPVPFGNGWMVRESISNALLRTNGEYLDSVILEYNKNSPYHLDVLDTLFEMKREGLIQSISTQNFPPSQLQSVLGCGFNVRSNDVVGNLMNTNNLHSDSELGRLCHEYDCSRLVSAPLGGGLFTNQYFQYQEWAHLPVSSKKMFNTLFDSCCMMPNGAELDNILRWKKYRKIMDVLSDISFKHQASVESTALRWLLQLNDGDCISVGTQMGMDFIEKQGGQPYSRHRNLRQVFTFSLEEDDMDRLYRASGFGSDKKSQSELDDEHEIDFANRALWI